MKINHARLTHLLLQAGFRFDRLREQAAYALLEDWPMVGDYFNHCGAEGDVAVIIEDLHKALAVLKGEDA